MVCHTVFNMKVFEVVSKSTYVFNNKQKINSL